MNRLNNEGKDIILKVHVKIKSTKESFNVKVSIEDIDELMKRLYLIRVIKLVYVLRCILF